MMTSAQADFNLSGAAFDFGNDMKNAKNKKDQAKAIAEYRKFTRYVVEQHVSSMKEMHRITLSQGGK